MKKKKMLKGMEIFTLYGQHFNNTGESCVL